MIRILNIVTIMNRAGLESRLMDIYRNIDRQRIQFDFYTNRMQEGEFDNEIKELGGRVYYSSQIYPGRESSKVKEFHSFLTRNPEYRIIHAHVNEWSVLFCKVAMRAGVPVRIAHSRGANKSLSLGTLYKDILRLPIKKYATHYFAVSKEAGEHLFGKRAVDNGSVLVWPNAIDTERFRIDLGIRQTVRKDLGLKDEVLIMHVGNLSPVKNHLFLLHVFKEIKLAIPSAKLVMIGEGSQRGIIENWILNNSLSNSVYLLGNRSDVPHLLQAGDLFIFPSYHEGFPGAVLEAETSGLPCLISDTITDEVVLTDRVKQLSLRLSPKEWASFALKSIQERRTDCVDLVKSAGYDIHRLVERLEAFYFECTLQEAKK